MRSFILLSFLLTTGAWAQNYLPGKVNFSRLANSSLDPYTDSPTTAQEQWFQTYFTRMVAFSPYFDTRTAWYRNAQVYQDLYAIYAGSAVATQNPQWILHDQKGNPLYIPFGCGNGTCPQYAADIANPGFRAWWISQVQQIFRQGSYRGVFVDDVNTDFSVSDGNGNAVAPIDDSTGAPMTWAAWRNYVAQFVTQIRQAFPGKEIVHNIVWYAGPPGVLDQDPAIQQELAAADIINLERGVGSDPGLTGGTSFFSLYSLFGFIDRLHEAGHGGVLQQYNVTDEPTQEYSLAGYYLNSTGTDYYGDTSTTPANWWSGLNMDLGAPLGPRTYNNGIYQRNYTGGIVLLGEPGLTTTRTITLPGSFQTMGGLTVSSVTLGATQGAVLHGTYPKPVTPALSLLTSSLPAAVSGASYDAGLYASGGSGSYSFSVSGAPPGLAIGNWRIVGTPYYQGFWNNVAVTVKDTVTGAQAHTTLSLRVYPSLSISTSSLPFGIVGSSYSANLDAFGGSGTYSWSIVSQPAGLGINGSKLAGTPSAPGVSSNVIVTLMDSVTALSVQKTFSISVFSLPVITTASLPPAKVGSGYSAPLAASGGSGNFAWSATGLPRGLSVNGSTLSGNPGVAGSFSVAVTVKDKTTGASAHETLTLTVAAKGSA